MAFGKTCFVATLAALVVGTSVNTATAAGKYKIDPVHSAVVFKVKHREISHVWGRFNAISGVIKVNRLRDPSELDFMVEIKSESVDTNDKARDKDLRGAKFLNTTSHPKITFRGKTVKRLDGNKFELSGKIGLLGGKKDLTVIFGLVGVKRTSRAEFRLGGETTFTIKPSDFGMAHMVPEIGDEVTVMVSIEAVAKLSPAG